MAAVERAVDVRDLGIRPAKRGRKFLRELIIGIGFECWDSRWEISRTPRNGWRVSEYTYRLLRRTYCKYPQITITKVAVISLSLEIRKNLNGPVGIRTKGRPGLHGAIHMADAIVVGNVRIVPWAGISDVPAHRH